MADEAVNYIVKLYVKVQQRWPHAQVEHEEFEHITRRIAQGAFETTHDARGLKIVAVGIESSEREERGQ